MQGCAHRDQRQQQPAERLIIVAVVHMPAGPGVISQPRVGRGRRQHGVEHRSPLVLIGRVHHQAGGSGRRSLMNMPQRTATAASIAVRQAAEYDLVERLRLRSLLFDDLAGDFFNPATGDGSWLDALAVVLKQQLTVDDVRILVVDADGGGDDGG